MLGSVSQSSSFFGAINYMVISNSLKKMSMVTAGVALAFVGLIGRAQPASAQVITFDNDTDGFKSNGFVSASDPTGSVRFSDPIILDPTAAEPDGLFVVSNNPPEIPGRALSNTDDDASPINFNFSTPVTSLSFLFGNDTTPGGVAQLQTFNNGALVGTATRLFNGTEQTDQTIAFTDGQFNSASFRYNDATGAALPLIETIDNVAIEPIPEPSSILGLLTFGAFGAMTMLKRKQRNCKN